MGNGGNGTDPEWATKLVSFLLASLNKKFLLFTIEFKVFEMSRLIVPNLATAVAAAAAEWRRQSEWLDWMFVV